MGIRRAVALAALAGSVLMPGMAQAAGIVETGDKIKILEQIAPNSTGGGPFLIDDLTDSSVTNFLTFCIERDEFLAVGGEYYVKLSTQAEAGGVDTNAGDTLSNETGYLYSKFINGTLAGYTGDQESREGLQLAIWRLEGEVGATYSGLAPSAQAKATTFYNDAMGSGATSTFGVMVMQLWTAYNPTTQTFSGYKQDQIVLIPVPEMVSTFSALLLGAGALAVARRRLVS
jgi:hypothetical protein